MSIMQTEFEEIKAEGTGKHQEEAKRIGREMGLAGETCIRPSKIDRHYDADFISGWQDGADELADRQEIMESWLKEKEAGADWHEAELAEVGAYYTVRLTREGWPD